jgi:hypothetical protein
VRVTAATNKDLEHEVSEGRFRILRPYKALLLVLFAGFLLTVSAQSQQLESLTATAKGHGMVSSEVEVVNCLTSRIKMSLDLM